MSDDTGGLPLSFKTQHGQKRGSVILGVPVADIFVAEARQLGHHYKEAIVQEGAGGSSWRMTSDEGSYLGGTDLAPFPLGFFNAGLQSDLAGRVARLAKTRAIAWTELAVRVNTQYSLSGSFVQGTGQGYAEAVGAHVAFHSSASDSELTALVRDAVAQSPAYDLVQRPLENTFALYLNGRRRNPTLLPASTAAAPTDPFLKYAKAPTPLPDTACLGDLIIKTGERTEGAPATPAASTPTAGGRITWAVNGDGRIDAETGLYRCKVALNRPGSSHFVYTSDETEGDRAPSGLSLLSAAIAFCYMTQLSRYIEAMKLSIRNVRLVQLSPYAIDASARGAAGSCDTHLFLQGEAEEEMFERLQLIAANTCYLHQTMVCATPLDVVVSNGGRTLV